MNALLNWRHRRTCGHCCLAFDGAAVGMMVSDARMNIVRANAALLRLLGYSARELSALGMPALLHPGETALAQTLHGELFSGQRDSYQVVKRYVHRSGQILWCRVDVALVAATPGLPAFSVHVLEDITERTYLEEQSRQLLGSYELILNASGFGLFAVDRLGVIFIANSGATARLGWPPGALKGQLLRSVQMASGPPCAIEAALHDGLRRECAKLMLRCRDGSVLCADACVTPLLKGTTADAAVVTLLATADGGAPAAETGACI